jgi:hypothetical protein
MCATETEHVNIWECERVRDRDSLVENRATFWLGRDHVACNTVSKSPLTAPIAFTVHRAQERRKFAYGQTNATGPESCFGRRFTQDGLRFKLVIRLASLGEVTG